MKKKKRIVLIKTIVCLNYKGFKEHAIEKRLYILKLSLKHFFAFVCCVSCSCPGSSSALCP